MKKIEKAVILGLIMAILFNVASFGEKSRELYSNVLRLHILANSDSPEDQALKLKIRDNILSEGYFIFDGAADIDEAKNKVKNNINAIERIAAKTIVDCGYSYSVSAALEKAYFDTRYYDSFTLPAGEYEALRIVIGKGEGHNWWCVMFPPLCVSSAS